MPSAINSPPNTTPVSCDILESSLGFTPCSGNTARTMLRRIVSIVPWIAGRDGPTIDEICQRFGIDRADLLADLDVVFMVGIPPYTPDELIDVIIEDDRVWITLGRYFTRPLRLTADASGVGSAR